MVNVDAAHSSAEVVLVRNILHINILPVSINKAGQWAWVILRAIKMIKIKTQKIVSKRRNGTKYITENSEEE